MMRLKRKVATALLGVMAVLAVAPAGVAHATKVNTYTYNYDYWGMEYESADAYKPVSFVGGKDLGLTNNLRQPQGMFVRGNLMYVADTGNSRVLEIPILENGEMGKYKKVEVEETVDTEETTEATEATEATDAAETTDASETTETTEAEETTEATETVATDEIVEISAAVSGEIRVITQIQDPKGVLETVVLPETTESAKLAAREQTYAKVKSLTLSAPSDIFCTEEGDIYIADTGNYRILHLNSKLEVIKVLVEPDDVTWDAKIEFEPTKVVVDRAGRTFVLAKNVNKGLMRFEGNGNFIGFVGANQVEFNMMEYIKKLLSTKAQRDQMKDFVPVEYNNLYIDSRSFIYCTTAVFEEESLIDGGANPIRKINSLGNDILIRNGEWPPIGDIDWSDAGGYNGPSRITDVTAFDDETYYAVDRIRGHIFAYDEQGNLLYAFGGPGNQLGYFTYPVAIEHVGTDLYVLDSTTGGITRFTRTAFGDLIHKALDEYRLGHYEKSAEYWEEVLKLNGNYELAYIGIGRSLLRQEKYEEAMEYFEVKRDAKNYSRAWKYYRKEWIENNIGYVIVVLVALFLIPSVIKMTKRIRWEAREEYEYELKQKNK